MTSKCITRVVILHLPLNGNYIGDSMSKPIESMDTLVTFISTSMMKMTKVVHLRWVSMGSIAMPVQKYRRHILPILTRTGTLVLGVVNESAIVERQPTARLDPFNSLEVEVRPFLLKAWKTADGGNAKWKNQELHGTNLNTSKLPNTTYLPRVPIRRAGAEGASTSARHPWADTSTTNSKILHSSCSTRGGSIGGLAVPTTSVSSNRNFTNLVWKQIKNEAILNNYNTDRLRLPVEMANPAWGSS